MPKPVDTINWRLVREAVNRWSSAVATRSGATCARVRGGRRHGSDTDMGFISAADHWPSASLPVDWGDDGRLIPPAENPDSRMFGASLSLPQRQHRTAAWIVRRCATGFIATITMASAGGLSDAERSGRPPVLSAEQMQDLKALGACWSRPGNRRGNLLALFRPVRCDLRSVRGNRAWAGGRKDDASDGPDAAAAASLSPEKGWGRAGGL